MKKILSFFSLFIALVITGCSNSSSAAKENTDLVKGENTKVLVAYFSATGTTAKAAKQVADATGGSLLSIVPVEAYSDADLDYENDESRSSYERNHPELRPEIKKTDLDIAQYETIYLGFPIWWDKAPLVINTFLDSYNFEGKHIVIFTTAGSSPITGSYESLKAQYPNLDFTAGGNLTSATKSQWESWLKTLTK